MSVDLEIVDNSYFDDEFRLSQLKQLQHTQKVALDHSVNNQGALPNPKMGTVGCVALDSKGNLAAGVKLLT